MERVVVILVTYCETPFQQDLLLRSARAVRQYHPSATLVVLQDHHALTRDMCIPADIDCRYEFTRYPRCGEVNAYMWACEHVDEFTRFIFLHDSVILHGTLPVEFPEGIHFRPLWYASPYFASSGLMAQSVEDLMVDIRIGRTDGLQIYQRLLERGLYVIFGAMGCWDQLFCKYLSAMTTFPQNAHRFTTRTLRCLFERLVYCLFTACHPHLPFREIESLAICGDITQHSRVFSNTDLTPSGANNPYALKVWQGR